MADVGRERRDEGRLGATPWRAFVVIAGALLLAVLLNAAELESEAKAKPFGKERDFWVGVWKPFATVSRVFYLDKPREWADEALGRSASGRIFELPADAGATALPPGPGGSVPTGPAANGTPPKGANVTPTPSGPKRLIRTPSAADPLRVWVGGDSMSKILGEALVRQATESEVMAPTQESELSSGLTRPDFFDWPGRLNDLASESRGFEVYVVVFGANDAQGIKTPDGKIFQTGESGWIAEYRRRVAGTMDLLKGDNRLVVWVGQPIMRADDLSKLMALQDQIYKEEAAKRPWVQYLDLWDLFTTPGGDYDPYIRDDDGELKLMRHPDGVHLVRDGGEKAARHIMEIIRKEAGLP